MNQPQGYTVEAQRNAQIRHELTLRGATLIYTRRRNSNYQNPLEQETTIFSFADLHVATRNARLWESFIQQHCVVRRAISIVANVDRRVLAVVVTQYPS